MSGEYKYNSTFNPINVPTLKTQKELVDAVMKLVKSHNDRSGMHNKEYTNIARAIAQIKSGQAQITITGTNSNGGSSITLELTDGSLSVLDVSKIIAGLNDGTWITNPSANTAVLDNQNRSGDETIVDESLMVTVTFPAVKSSDYIVDACYVITAGGFRSECIPQIPPLTDSRTTTGFQIQPNQQGTLYWSIKPKTE